MNTITNEQFLAALQLDPEFQALSPAVQGVHQNYVNGLLGSLKELMMKQVSFKSYLESNIAQLGFAVNEGYLGALLNVLYKAQPMEATLEESVDVLTHQLSEVLEALKEYIAQFDAWVLSTNMSDSQLLCNPKSGLRADVIKRIEGGPMTVGELMLMQPTLFILKVESVA